SPYRFSRYLVVVLPLLAGNGATPASIANAASSRTRPGWDHAHSTVAATIGPTPFSASRSGRQDRTIARIFFLCSSASACSALARRARSRSTLAVVAVSTSQAGWTRKREAISTISDSFRSRSLARRRSGAAIVRLNSWRWATVAASTAERRAASSTDRACRSCPVRGVPWCGLAIASRAAHRVQRIGLRAVTALGALGPVELEDDLALTLQQVGQAGPVATGTLDGPHPQGWVLLGHLQKFLVAG